MQAENTPPRPPPPHHFSNGPSLIAPRLLAMQGALDGGAIWLPDTERFFMDLSRLISSTRQQQNATATQFDSAEFFIRRLEEYERTLSVLTLRVEESYTQEASVIDYLDQLLNILNELRCHFEEIAEECERDVDALEESAEDSGLSIKHGLGIKRGRRTM